MPMEALREHRDRQRSATLVVGWKAIATYLGMGVRTVQRYEREHGLPIRRPSGHPKAAVIATISELDAWVAAAPIRESFKLRTRAAATDEIMASLSDNMAKMKKLRDEMLQLRQELRGSVDVLHSSIRVVGVGPNEELATRLRNDGGFYMRLEPESDGNIPAKLIRFKPKNQKAG